ncbi:hypothetical protein, partial [Actinobacillus pleuropneumoniae]
AITADLSLEVRIHSFASGVHDTIEEMTKVQLELNLQIIKLWLLRSLPLPQKFENSVPLLL